MYPLVIVCKSKNIYKAYPCSVDAVPHGDSVLPMVGSGDTPDKALLDLKNSIRCFIADHGSVKANSVLDSIYGYNHVDLLLDNHPMMKYFTEII